MINVKKISKKTHFLIGYVIKLGERYTNGARRWNYTQKRAFLFRYDGKPDLKWAKAHLNSILATGDAELTSSKRLKKMRIVKIMRLASRPKLDKNKFFNDRG